MITKKPWKQRILILLVLYALLVPQSVLADDQTGEANGANATEAIQLTLDDVFLKAAAHSSTIKKVDYDIDSNEIKVDEAAEDVYYVPGDGTDDEASSAYLSLVQKNIALQTSKKTRSTALDALERESFEKYTNVLVTQNKVEAAQKSLEYANYLRLAALAKYQLGLINAMDRDNAQRDYNTKQAALSTAQSNLKDSYVKLNAMIGLDEGERPILTDRPTYARLEVDNLEAEIQSRINDSPIIWKADKAVEQAQLNLDLAPLSGSSLTPYEVEENSINSTKLSASDAREDLRQSMLTYYDNVLQLEQDYILAEQALAASQEDLRLNSFKYKLGLATQGDVLSSELSVANSQQSLQTLIYQHTLAKMTFEKPWAA